MCSKFGGDLADIIRGSSGGGGGSSGGFGNKMMTTSEELAVDPTWQFPSNPTNFSSEIIEERLDFFGDPFPNMQDPLLQHLDTPISPTYVTSNNISHISNNENNVTHNVFSRMGYQITSSVSPVVSAASLRRKSTASVLVSSGNLINNSGTSKTRHVMENQVLQISSPPNTGIKRRKSQAKKVVCIPAPAPPNGSKQSGEIVPSDLWAWRKYGQKPIKGSPYPRGYYRCSSSKGCSARKQVERSRTDPNMLVITYTCEHNHPWPTQRNALAGSTRSTSHTPKNNTSSSLQNLINNTSPTKDILKEDDEGHKESNSTSGDHPNVKEEDIMEDTHKRVEMEVQVPPFLQIYRPTLLDKPNQSKLSVIPLNEVGYMMDHSEDFFAGLGEIEAGPLDLLFEINQENSKETVALDPLGFYDWGVEKNNDSSNSNISRLLGGEVKGSVQQNPYKTDPFMQK